MEVQRYVEKTERQIGSKEKKGSFMNDSEPCGKALV